MRTPVLHLGEKLQGQGSVPQSRQESRVRLKAGGKFVKFLINMRAAQSVLTEPLRPVHASCQMTIQGSLSLDDLLDEGLGTGTVTTPPHSFLVMPDCLSPPNWERLLQKLQTTISFEEALAFESYPVSTQNSCDM